MASYTTEAMIARERRLIQAQISQLQEAKKALEDDYEEAREDKEEQLEDSREPATELYNALRNEFQSHIQQLRRSLFDGEQAYRRRIALAEELRFQANMGNYEAINRHIRLLQQAQNTDEASLFIGLRDHEITLPHYEHIQEYNYTQKYKPDTERLIAKLQTQLSELSVEQFMRYSQETRTVIEGYPERKARIERLISALNQDLRVLESLALEFERSQDQLIVESRLTSLQEQRIRQTQDANRSASEQLTKELESIAQTEFEQDTLEFQFVYEKEYEQRYRQNLLTLYRNRDAGDFRYLGQEKSVAAAVAADEVRKQHRSDVLELSRSIAETEAEEREHVAERLVQLQDAFTGTEEQYASVPLHQVPIRFFWKDTRGGEEYPVRRAQVLFFCLNPSDKYNPMIYNHRNAGNSITKEGELGYSFGHAATNYMGMLTANRHVDTKTKFEEAIGLPDKDKYNIRSNTYSERVGVWKEPPGEPSKIHFTVTTEQDLARLGYDTSDTYSGHTEAAYELKQKLNLTDTIPLNGELINQHPNSQARNHQINRLLALPKDHWFVFMAAPPTGVFVTKDLMANLDSPVLTYSDPDQPSKIEGPTEGEPYFKVYLHCTLPAWSQRIFQLSSDIRQLTEFMAKDSAVLYHDLNCVQEMKLCNQWNQKFANGDVDVDDLQQKLELDLALDTLHEYIQKTLESPDAYQPSAHIKLKREIDQRAERLIEWLNSEALKAELDRYLNHIKEQDASQSLPPGPDMLAESDWPHFFNAVSDALSTLAMTSQRERAAEMLGPWLDLMAGELDGELTELFGDENWINSLNKQLEEETTKNTQQLASQKDRTVFNDLLRKTTIDIQALPNIPDRGEENLLTTLWDGWSYFKGNWGDNLFHRRPGPPSLLQVALDSYGSYVSTRLLELNHRSPSSLLRFNANVYGMLIGKEIWESNSRGLSELAMLRWTNAHFGRGNAEIPIVNQRMAQADQFVKFEIRDFIRNARNQNTSDITYDRLAGNRFSKAYAVTVAVTGLVGSISSLSALQQELKDNPNSTMTSRQLVSAIYNTLGLTAAGAATYNSVLQRYAWASGLHQKMLGLSDDALAASKASVAAFCDTFATHLGYLAAVESTFKAVELYQSERSEQATVAALNAACAVATTLGYQMGQAVAGGAGIRAVGLAAFFVPGIGQVLLIGGLVLQIGLVAYELLLPYLQTGLKNRFSEVMAKLERSPYYNDYFSFTGQSQRQARYPDLAAASDIIKKQNEDRLFTSIWSELSWRAIVPIYLQQRDAGDEKGVVNNELIEKVMEIINDGVLRLGEATDPSYRAPTASGMLPHGFYELQETDVADLVRFYFQLQVRLENYTGEGEPPRLPSGRYCREVVIDLENGTYEPHPDDHRGQIWCSKFFRLQSQSRLGTSLPGVGGFENLHLQVTD